MKDQYILDARGQRKAVIIPVKRYRQLIEDLHDLVVVAERRTEGTVNFDKMKRRLKQDGLL